MDVIKLACQNEAAETRVKELSEKLRCLQENFVSALKPVLSQFPELGDSEQLNINCVGDLVSKLHSCCNKQSADTDRIVSAIRVAVTEIPVL